MRNAFSFLFATFFALSAVAQDIPSDFIKNSDKPIVIENPSKGKTLFFFYPEKLRSESFAKEGNPCKAYELTSATLQVAHTSPEIALTIPGDDPKMRVLCRFSRADDYFIVLGNSDMMQVLRIEGQGLTLQRIDTYTAKKGERIINGVADGTNAYILSSQKVKKEGDRLLVYQIDASGHLQKHSFPVGEKYDRAIDDMFKGSFNPLSVEYGTEEEPEAASSKAKLFADEQKLWVTMDNSFSGDNDQAQAAMLKIVIFDLATDSLHLKRFSYTDKLVFNASNEKRNSFIFDKKIFQLYMNHEELLLRVRDLGSGEPLFTKILLREDTIEGLANSPILVPGRGTFGIEKEYRSVHKFVKRFSKFAPFIQVRRAGDDYLMCIGGHEEINTYAGSHMSPTTGMWTGGYSGSYERSFSFYSAINAQTMTRSPVFFKKSLVSAYEDMLSALDRPRDQALYHIGEHFYLGYFDKAEKKYRLKRMKVQTQ